jgi:hypothetical protein
VARLLLQDALNNLAPETLPAGSQSTQIAWINAVLARFFGAMKAAGTTVRWKATSAGASFNIQFDANGQAYITLPRNMLSLLASAYGTTNNGQPPSYNVRFSTMQINGPWHEFGNGGYGVGDQVWGRGMLDAGDNWTTFTDITAPSYLQIVTSQAEASGAKMIFRGQDQNGNEIYTGTGSATIQGVSLDISTGLTTQTTQQFGASPTLVQKPVTYGPVTLNAVNVATGAVTLLAIYDPGDTSPGFRRYKLGGQTITPGNPIPYTTLHSMVKRRFVAAVSLSDELIPGSMVALEAGLNGRRWDLQGKDKIADGYWEEAFSVLNSELNEFQGAAVPRIIFQKGSNLAGGAVTW